MGRHRYAGRTVEKISIPSGRLCSGCNLYMCFFGPDWFLTGRAFVFHPMENPVTLEARVRSIAFSNFPRPLGEGKGEGEESRL
jgi:hypothetical protein